MSEVLLPVEESSIWYVSHSGTVSRLDNSEYLHKQTHTRRDLRVMQALLHESLSNVSELLVKELGNA